MFTSLENFLSNLSFLTLFLSMLIYWVEISKFTFIVPAVNNKKTQNSIGSLSYNIRTSFVESAAPSSNGDQFQNPNFGQIGVVISNLVIFLLLILRWKESGHFPLSNLFESLMFLSWTLTSIHLFLEFHLFKATFSTVSQNTGSNREVEDSKAFTKNLFMAKLLGSITTPSALFTNAFATFSLPKEMQEASPLVPALQSNWLMMHVTVMILSYGALICGSLLAIAFLVITGMYNSEGSSVVLKGSSQQIWSSELNTMDSSEREKSERDLVAQNLKEKVTKPMPKTIAKLARTFDNLSYRILGLGFPLLTIGILSGAVWANEAWGSYWSWDPKETWALLTWLVFAIYLHTRLNKGWQGKKPALIASLGFVSVWVCYLGVNLLGEGLHSYGWLQN